MPTWWHWVSSHMEGLLWPDADTVRLRTVGQRVDHRSRQPGVVGGVRPGRRGGAGRRRPRPRSTTPGRPATTWRGEPPRWAVPTGRSARPASTMPTPSTTTTTRSQDAVADFIRWTILIEGAGVLLSEVGGELVAQGAEAARIASAARRIVGILRPWSSSPQALASRLCELVRVAASVLERLKAILGARAVRAVEATAQQVARAGRRGARRRGSGRRARGRRGQARSAGDRHDLPRRRGRIVWLERGDERRGLAHILGRHGAEFVVARLHASRRSPTC